jgi:hypothetical protein
MAIEHVMVSNLSNPTEHDLHNQPQSADFPWKLDGIPVCKEVYDLGTELRLSFAGYRFHATIHTGNRIVRITYKDGVEKHCYSDVAVYIEGSDYVVGRIGYGNNYSVKPQSSNPPPKPTYMIYSRKIQNTKFKEHRDQYNMSFVGDLKRAVKVGLTKLTPYTVREMAELTYQPFKGLISTARSRVFGSLNSTLLPLQSMKVLLSELKGLIAQGVQFSTPEFQAAAEKVLAVDREWESVRNKPMPGRYVRVRMVGEQQWADFIDISDMQFRDSISNYAHTSLPIDELSDDTQGKLAVLSMATVGQYMQGVGQRVSEKAFWVERDV